MSDETFDLGSFPVHLGLGATVEPLPEFDKTPQWYEPRSETAQPWARPPDRYQTIGPVAPRARPSVRTPLAARPGPISRHSAGRW